MSNPESCLPGTSGVLTVLIMGYKGGDEACNGGGEQTLFGHLSGL